MEWLCIAAGLGLWGVMALMVWGFESLKPTQGKKS
jgi:hypothetical protein